jgi:hypothetical protein
VVFAVTKFMDGAWIVLLLVPLLVATFFAIHHHYRHLDQQLAVRPAEAPWRRGRHCVLVPIARVHQGTRAALHYARLLSEDITAVHVAIDAAEAEQVRQQWQQWGEGIRLVMLESPYRQVVEPLLQYIAEVARHRQPAEIITIVVPQFVPQSWWQNFLHNQTAVWLRLALLFTPGVVVTDVPFHPD